MMLDTKNGNTSAIQPQGDFSSSAAAHQIPVIPAAASSAVARASRAFRTDSDSRLGAAGRVQ